MRGPLQKALQPRIDARRGRPHRCEAQTDPHGQLCLRSASRSAGRPTLVGSARPASERLRNARPSTLAAARTQPRAAHETARPLLFSPHEIAGTDVLSQKPSSRLDLARRRAQLAQLAALPSQTASRTQSARPRPP